ncbi:MAG: 16S rRNA (guanine(966)-N(2))-methyltransferase RsmD [Clostridiales bacterium]|nr:16S rRNA (guanine(966)-N(2))-methyltransferase RsmD [Clostridiales bacterium]
MRIIAGTARSRPIKAPRGMDTRPTLDRVRETIFNILQFDVQQARVLDLYAGSGALSLEAVSRGAEHAYLVDMGRAAAQVIKENIALLRFEDKCTFLPMTDTQALSRLAGERFDLVFLDPPYRMDTTDIILRMRDMKMLDEDSVLVVEFDKNEPRLPEEFVCYKQREFGEIRVHFYRLEKKG